MSKTLTDLADALDTSSARCTRAQEHHQALRDSHAARRGLISQLTQAANNPDPAALKDIAGKLGAATEAEGQAHQRLVDAHDGLRRGLDAAKLALDGHKGELDSAKGQAADDPTQTGKGTSAGTGPAGVGVSSGFATKSLPLTVAEIRAQDQAIGCEIGYRAKIDAMRAR